EPALARGGADVWLTRPRLLAGEPGGDSGWAVVCGGTRDTWPPGGATPLVGWATSGVPGREVGGRLPAGGSEDEDTEPTGRGVGGRPNPAAPGPRGTVAGVWGSGNWRVPPVSPL